MKESLFRAADLVSCEFCINFKNAYLEDDLQTAASLVLFSEYCIMTKGNSYKSVPSPQYPPFFFLANYLF